MRDEQIIPSSWPGQRGSGSSSLGVVRSLLLGGGGHGVDAGEVVEEATDGVGDRSGAVAS